MHESARLLRDLVRLPSVNPMGRAVPEAVALEYRVTAYLEEFFRGLGVRCERQPVAPGRENILAFYEAPGAPRTLMLEAHQDTVPTDHMSIDPFGARVERGKLYGRGACDIKGGLAAMLTAFARVVREKPAGAPNVIMACSVDEEFTFLGVQRMAQAGRKVDGAVVAEPTKLDVVTAHKGAVRWHLHTTGRSCHSSSPEQGVNAIYRMGKILSAIEHYADELRQSRSDPVLGPPTMSVGLIAGGTSVNTVPDRCRIEIDRRLLPGEDPLKTPEDLRAYLAQQPGIDFPFQSDAPWLVKTALGPAGSEALAARLGRAIDAVRGGHRVLGVPYGTDASTLADAGIPAVVFGPGDIAQAHTHDEWVDLAEVEGAVDILFRFLTTAPD
jgi:acetylornithine deacetylase